MPRCLAIRAAPESARKVTVGTSYGRARVSMTPARSPESSRAPSTRFTGRALKYVYGSPFWKKALTPRTVSPPVSISIRGGLTTYLRRNTPTAAEA